MTMTMRTKVLSILPALAVAVALTACQMPQPPRQRAAPAPGAPAAAAPAAGAYTTSAGGIPAGTIVAYYGADIPAGWLVCDGQVSPSGRRTPDLRNRFIMGLDRAALPALGERGGSVTHMHKAETGPPHGAKQYDSGRHDAANDDHTHEVTVHPANSLPPYVKLVYIMKE
jgi:hypothetical protein